jgi:uncharacterized protein (TIGR00730 family)
MSRDPRDERKLLPLQEVPGDAERRALVSSMMESVLALASPEHDLADLKLTERTLAEFVRAFETYRPHRELRKITIFGSARTPDDHPLYALTRAFAAEMHQRDWMVVTGAGPGIMKAGMEGAGREGSLGVNVVLPFEQSANHIIDGSDKLVTMQYFFSRKVMLTKESRAFAGLPGGFGTMDEVFEVLTLIQAGKFDPAPVVLLDTPDGGFWEEWERFVDRMARERYINQAGPVFHRRCTSAKEAADHIEAFYSNYLSAQFDGEQATIRVRRAPTQKQLDALERQFASLCAAGTFEVVADEALETDRLSASIIFQFSRRNFDVLRKFIDALNEF